MSLKPSTAPTWRRLIVTVTILPVALVLLLGGLLGWMVYRAHDAAAWAGHSQEVLRVANRVEAGLNAMGTGQRGFLITGRPAFREPYDQALATIDDDLRLLEGLVSDNPAQQARARSLHPVLDAWVQASEHEMRLKARNDPALLPTFVAGRSAGLMEDVRRHLNVFRAEERRLLSVHEARMRQDARVTTTVGLVAVLGSAFFLATVGRRHSRMVGKLYKVLAERSLMLEAAHDAILVREGPGQVVTFWNQGATHIYGYTADEALGRDPHELLHTTLPEPLEAILATLNAAGRWEGEMLQRRRDGAEIIVESRWTLHVDAHGRRHILENNHNVTTNRLAQRALAEDQILQLDELRRADVLKDQFIGILSHELRTPINAITGFGSLLEEQVLGPLSDRQRSYMRKIMATAETLLMLVNDLLDASAMRAGHFTIAPDFYTLREITDAVTARLVPLAEQRGQAITTDIAADLPAVRADNQRVQQVLTNLVGNAIKFTPHGGHIALRARLVDGQVRIEVTDDGPGIRPEDRSRLFKPFSQITQDAGHTTGTGLGLSISRAIVEAHGGSIGLDGSPSGGSTFWFTLPTREQ
ncbi:MAG: ATP-binding protein [Candidatus Sericytochromatia bacterium]